MDDILPSPACLAVLGPGIVCLSSKVWSLDTGQKTTLYRQHSVHRDLTGLKLVLEAVGNNANG